MDEDRRARLIEKRRLALLRMERAGISATFRSVAPALRAGRVRCSKLVPARCLEALGRLASGPGQDERLLWAPVPNSTCRGWEAEAERDSLLREALADCTAPDARVAVVWHPCRAGLSLAAADLARNAGPILDSGGGETIWIVAAGGGPWLIEVAYWDRELCWTPQMPVWAEEARGPAA
jgi:hypothetical protein